MNFCKSLVDYSLYFVTNSNFTKNPSYLKNIEKIIRSGVSVIQIREKDISTQEYIEKAREIHQVAQNYNVPVIVNDRVDVAFESGVDGVHVGTNDVSVSSARKILGEDKIIGATASSDECAIELIKESADYLGTDAIFLTQTKTDCGTPKGIDWLSNLKESVNMFVKADFPVVAIGGIDHDNICKIFSAGVYCIAVSEAIAGAEDFSESTKSLRYLVDSEVHGEVAAELLGEARDRLFREGQ